ncbi:MAG: DUF2793 domain-containing protein [Methylobacterium sp.]|uniref:DUF2793 domain-containing protein n=1 Tax=Methylobacterium sp. TaxID=409 RepID=UPI0025888EE5|nr:DUF2793 domain-containing protein [Methylobacterium sp.]MBY0300003.1 DUF2793 domain-containing protein [Methylobacterium sp.]
MSEATPLLALPLLAAAQAQKHVTHNEALTALDTLVQLAVLDKDLTAPPSTPAEGDRYLIASPAPTGAWAGWAGRIVRYQDGAWRAFVPKPGWVAYVADEADLYTYTGPGGWVGFRATLTALHNLTRLGIGTSADAANPFAAKLNAALWTARGSTEGGTGDLRYTLNKEGPARVLSLLLQSGFSGRAELGLIGDDDLSLKVSADGGTWREALRVARASGGLDLTAAEADAAAAATVDLGALAALQVAITGAGTVTSFGRAPNRLRFLRFTGAATLVHDPARLILPGAASLVTAPGDTALAASDGAGLWRVLAYARASGKALAGPAAAEITDASSTGRTVLTGLAAQGAAALGLGPSDGPTFATLTAGSFVRFQPARQLDFNDGKVGARLFARGLNIIGVASEADDPQRYLTMFGLLELGGPLMVHGWTWLNGTVTVGGGLHLASYTVATVPAAAVGTTIYVSNARKAGEASGAGTGVVAYYSNGAWRRPSDDSAIAA